MVNDLPIQYQQDEMERDAFNSAFNELGFVWSWDSETYARLVRQNSDATERVRQYLETSQSHLLKAYDATFLVNAIQEKKAEYRKRATAGHNKLAGYFDRAQSSDRQLGA